MIYDCFTYLHEKDLLELRIGYLNPKVDKFVVVEATKTLSNIEKEPNFMESSSHFPEEWKEKIDYSIVDNFSREGAEGILMDMADAIRDRLKTVANEEDLLMISDIDQIPHIDSVSQDIGSPTTLPIRRFFLWFNTPLVRSPEGPIEAGTILCRKSDLHRDLRQEHCEGRLPLSDAPCGWHFSHLGNSEQIREKMLASHHTNWGEDCYSSVEVLDRHRHELTLPYGSNYVLEEEVINSSYPSYLIENLDRFRDLIYHET
jgi:beta-1,4-mannosyl-glycoprotein beta-1,4-N-acetylglucosaminyltransferase